jgi:hypothetical protein
MKSADVLGSTVSVFWEGDQAWYDGVIDDFHPDRGYHIQYFDGEEEWLPNLDTNVKFDAPASTSVGKGALTGSPRFDTDSMDFMDLDTELELNVVSDLPAAAKATRVEPLLSPKSVSRVPPPSLKAAVSTLPIVEHKPSVSFSLKSAASTVPGSSSREAEVIEHAMDIAVPALTTCQQHNREIVQSQLVFLHQRGVLLVGNVLGVTLYDQELPAVYTFKVLFVEGGSQPAMFRCKIPVFTSLPVMVSTEHEQPRWSENTFRCDMIMAEIPGNVQRPFGISGEVMISLYRARANGGQDLLGHSIFDFAKIAQSGTIETFQQKVQGRSLSGNFSIIQGNQVVGEFEIQFNIAWNSRPCDEINDSETALRPKVAPKEATSKSKVNNNKSTTATTKMTTVRPTSAAAVKVVGGPTTSGRSATQQRPSSGVTPATASKFVVPPQRKIVSKIARQQREDSLRIEKENQALKGRIQKLVQTSGVAYNGGADAKLVISQLSGAVNNSQQYAAEAKDTAKLVEEKRKKAVDDKLSVPVVELGGGKKDIATLNTTYANLKKSIANEDEQIANLRAKLNNLNIHIDRYTSQLGRNKQQEKGSDRSVKGDTPISSSAGEMSGRSPRVNTNKNDDNTDYSAQPKNKVTSEIKLGPEINYPDYENADSEYKAVKEEYDILQKMRRGLVERIQKAKQSIGNVQSQNTVVDMKEKVLKARLLSLGDEFAPFLMSSDMKVSDDKQIAIPVEHDDVALYLKNRSLRDEIIMLEATATDSPQRLQHESSCEELLALIKALKIKRDEQQRIVENLREKKAKLLADVKKTSGDNVLFTLRDRITMMRAMELKDQTANRQKLIVKGIKEADIEILRLKLIGKERERLKSLSDIGE